MSDGGHITLVRTRPPDFTPGGVTWVGETEETSERAVLMLWKDGHLSGYFGYKGRVFTVNHVGGDVHTMAEIDPRKLPPDHAPDPAQRNPSVAPPPAPATLPPPPPEPEVAPFPDAERQALEAKQIVIDVMLLYHQEGGRQLYPQPRRPVDARHRAGQPDVPQQRPRQHHAAARAQPADRLRRGGSVDQFDHLYRMVDGVGVFKDLKKLRNEKRADIVGLVLDSPTRLRPVHPRRRRGGRGLLRRAPRLRRHHLLDRARDRPHPGHPARPLSWTPTTSRIAFAHGYINGTKWRDMMSYQEGCDGCPRIPYWSNPRVRYQGEPTGTAASDNARVILEQAERVVEVPLTHSVHPRTPRIARRSGTLPLPS